MKIPQYTAKSCLALQALAFGLISGPLAAQDSAAQGSAEIEEVVVTGIRRGLSQARDVKRSSDQFVDAVIATDIGKLPDTNIAESLQRVSGVQLDRGIGEGTNISIRGLRNNIILVNGREVFDAGGRGSRGPGTLGTGSYSLLSMIPSELVSRLEVTKLAGADEIEGAVGGVVNIVTARPLDQAGLRASGSVQAKYFGLSDETQGKGSFLVSNTFSDETFGLQLSGSFGESAIREDGFNTFGGFTRLNFLNRLNFTNIAAGNAVTGPDGELVNPDPNGDGVLGIYHSDPRYWQIDDAKERAGFNFVAQWRPNDTMEVIYDALYSSVDSDRERRWLSMTMAFSRQTDAILNDDEVLVSGVSNALLFSNVEYGAFTNEVLTQALSLDWDISDRLSMNAEASLNDTESFQHQNYFRMRNTTRFPTPYDLTPTVPAIGIHGAALQDADAMRMDVVFDTMGRNMTDAAAFRVDFDQELSDTLSLEYGMRLSTLETDFTRTQRDVRPFLSVSELVDADFVETWNSPDFFSGEAPMLTRSYITMNESVKPGLCTTMETFFRNHPDPSKTQAFENGRGGTRGCDTAIPTGVNNIKDEFSAAYVKLNYDVELGAVPVSGNVGVRYVDRDLTTTGTIEVAGVLEPLVVPVNQGEVLPSLVAKFDLTDEWVIRAGVAKVLSFPGTATARNDLFIFPNGTGRGGSPEADPFIANQLDVSLEYYFSEDAVVSIGYFTKDIESFLVSSSSVETVPEYLHEDGYRTTEALIARQINGDGGDINGIELLYQQAYTELPEPFDGLGVMATYSIIDSSTPFEDPFGATLPQPGLSENNTNLVAYWEKGPVGLRLAYNWRDEYLTSLGFEGTGIYDDSYEDLSFTAYWDVTDRATVNFEAVNLTDERRKQFNTVKSATRSIVEYGPSFALSVSADF